MFCQGRKYATESPVVPDGGRLTRAAMSDLFYILLTDGESPYTDSDRDYKDELRDSFPPHLTGPSLGKIRDMSPATLTVMVRVGKNGEWKPLWDSCGKAAEWMGKPAKEIAMHALGNGSSFHVQSDKLHPRACASMVCGEMPPTSISAVFENRGCMDPCHLVNSCRVIEVRWGTSDEVTQIYSMPHVTRTRAREWLDSDKGRAVLDTRKTTDFVAVLSTFNGVDNALRCNVVHRRDATILNLLHSAAKTITWGSCFLPTRIHSEHCYGAAEGCVDIYHIDCWGSGVGGKRKRVQVTMAVLAPTLDPPLESATPFVRRHWEKTSLKRGVNPRGVNAKRPKVLEGAKGPEKTKGLVPKVPKPPPALLRLKDLARWCGKPMKRYVVFGGATKIARDDAKEGCLWAKAIVSLADRDMDSCMRHVEEIRSLIGGLKGINEEHIEEAGKYISIINDAVQDTSACANVLMHV